MEEIYASLIAVVGTLLGALSTFWFQRLSSLDAAASARKDRFRQEQLAACADFIGTVTEVKRAVINHANVIAGSHGM